MAEGRTLILGADGTTLIALGMAASKRDRIDVERGTHLKPHVIRFIDDYFRDVETGDAGIFAGAGLSVPAGFVDWRELLRPLANEIDLDIMRESDMVAVAQFHVNANGMNRARLHRAVVEAFSSDAPPTPNHELPRAASHHDLVDDQLRQAHRDGVARGWQDC